MLVTHEMEMTIKDRSKKAAVMDRGSNEVKEDRRAWKEKGSYTHTSSVATRRR
jgi:ABC-type methionine transport system ATPase subunit